MPQPCRRDLRARLFWHARWLLGGSEYHNGLLEVVVRDGRAHDAANVLTLRPQMGEEIYDADIAPERGEQLTHLIPRLIATLVSADEHRILRIIAERAPVPAKVVAVNAGVERSKCYALLTNLRDRALIVDHGEGYVIAEQEIWEMIMNRYGTDARQAA